MGFDEELRKRDVQGGLDLHQGFEVRRALALLDQRRIRTADARFLSELLLGE